MGIRNKNMKISLAMATLIASVFASGCGLNGDWVAAVNEETEFYESSMDSLKEELNEVKSEAKSEAIAEDKNSEKNNNDLNSNSEVSEENEVDDDSSIPDFMRGAIAYDEHDFSNHRFLAFDGKEESNPDRLMAHNIYSDPQLPANSRGFNGFIIDFKADNAAEGTYWALCNWAMDTTCLNGKYNNINNGGAYCGLQSRRDGKKAIMSFWNIECDNDVITPTLVYPVRDGNTYFSNEGSGANFITDFEWKEGKWYRMFIECYDDPESNHTFVDMWVLEIETGIYTRICCYDTKLEHSYFTGGMSQFMENYDYNSATKVRSFQYANLQVRDVDSNEWTTITDSRLRIDTWWGNKKGDFEFGSTSTNLWGITCGYGDDVAPLNSDFSSIEKIH